MPKKKKKRPQKRQLRTEKIVDIEMDTTARDEMTKTLAQLIDGSADDFKLHLVGKNLGYVHSLTILLEQTYMQLVAMKNNYREKAIAETDPEKVKELDEAYQHTINEMLKIEEKQTFLIQWENELKNGGLPHLTS